MSEVVLRHHPYKPGQTHLITVYDKKTGEVLFSDTLRGVADWLDIFGYRFICVAGVWSNME